MGESNPSAESARMAPDTYAVKEMEELKTEIAIEPKLQQKPSASEKVSAIHKPAAAEEPSSGDGSIGISLIDLAEILDQHKQWVESGGESGARADLTGVNLAKADLTGINLQGSILHRVNMAGADLSIAHLRKASFRSASLHPSDPMGNLFQFI